MPLRRRAYSYAVVVRHAATLQIRDARNPASREFPFKIARRPTADVDLRLQFAANTSDSASCCHSNNTRIHSGAYAREERVNLCTRDVLGKSTDGRRCA